MRPDEAGEGIRSGAEKSTPRRSLQTAILQSAQHGVSSLFKGGMQIMGQMTQQRALFQSPEPKGKCMKTSELKEERQAVKPPAQEVGRTQLHEMSRVRGHDETSGEQPVRNDVLRPPDHGCREE